MTTGTETRPRTGEAWMDVALELAAQGEAVTHKTRNISSEILVGRGFNPAEQGV